MFAANQIAPYSFFLAVNFLCKRSAMMDDLSDEARRLLDAARQGKRSIIYKKSHRFPGYLLGVPGSDFKDLELRQSSDDLAVWEDALGELVSHGLIEERDPPGDLYKLTDED